MSLATGQVHFLALTRRKADCEYGLTLASTRKMMITREMNDLAREYSSKMGQKMVGYYDNNKYHEMTYEYLMGYGNMSDAYSSIVNGSRPLKSNNGMLLTAPDGRVILSDRYANAITSVCGVGNGQKFSENYIPQILNKLFPQYTVDEFQNGVTECHWSGTATTTTGYSYQADGDASDFVTSGLNSIINFYLPIFQAAAVNGWTTEYNAQMVQNPHYLTDALSSGALILAQTNEAGYYDECASLTYFVTSGDVEMRQNTERRAELEAEYEARRAEISEKEEMLELEITDYSAELEAIKTEMESIKTFIQDAISSVFSWGTSG